ncbi:nucleotidyltransferase domain-containing protein [Staphylothermus hellenicus]|uniref:Polymerase nucleotidyl transferase domain-containing protein n=1 Tax=Staphylothermus hellenicus (strain DSM 12710 / JCM 10830 / BK20S6-10-b1 / P8) TaxID=591019 RepID=D7D8H2_STAHD|nr:nucleotidyltransferase domain-containing protein [Staphylothermus hellenicus]ADI32068.1 hypothetical protein Shell_0962 [Staphylothermus hellenicus DSM 12710]
MLPNAEIYVFSGAAENRLTVLSDVDVLVVIDAPLIPRERRRIKADIIWNAEKYGFHVISRIELPMYLKHMRKLVPINKMKQ